MRPRRLRPAELAEVLEAVIPCRLATVDPRGFPRITPLWFIWAQDAFWMTSLNDRRHIADLRRSSKAGLCIDTELAPEPGSPNRPNRQITVRGEAQLTPDVQGEWTRRITLKYSPGRIGRDHAEFRAAQSRTVICLRPDKLNAFGAP
jgi:nitroimidazol reductase NimA-like FMN-containing flavoprotein (pyridoxamine 5'-phosphate oxidase superfamily)